MSFVVVKNLSLSVGGLSTTRNRGEVYRVSKRDRYHRVQFPLLLLNSDKSVNTYDVYFPYAVYFTIEDSRS